MKSATLPGRALLAAVSLLASGIGLSAEPCHPEFTAQNPFGIANNFGTSIVTDLDEDGHLDLSVGLTYYLGDGSGAVGPPLTLRAPIPVAFDIRAADFDDDGSSDLAMVEFRANRVLFFWGTGGRVGEQGIFDGPTIVNIQSVAENVWHIDLGDFDNDGRPDIAGASFGGPTILLLMNSGDRRFKARSIPASVPFNHMLAVGDFDGDSLDDLAVGRGPDVGIHFGQGNASFTGERAGRLPAGSGHRFRAADLDGDGRSDLCATSGQSLVVYLGRTILPTRGLPAAPSYRLQTGGGTRFLELIDMNEDGRLDIVSLAETVRGSVFRVFVAEGEGEELDFVAGPSNVTRLSGHGSVLAVGDMNEDGAPDVVVTTEDTRRGQIFLSTVDCPTTTALPGDVDIDGALAITDAIRILDFLFRGGSLPCPAAADVNSDSATNLADAISLLNYLFLAGPAPSDEPRSCDES